MSRSIRNGLAVDDRLVAFIEDEVITATGIDMAIFWRGLSDLIHGKMAENQLLLNERANLKSQIDGWHIARRNRQFDLVEYKAFLREIGYLLPQVSPFSVDNGAIDYEIATISGPQLVVPIMNARYALNATNARWGSLYDVLYGTNALGDLPTSSGYDAMRGARVMTWSKNFLDDIFTLSRGSHADVSGYRILNGILLADSATGVATLNNPSAFAGYCGDASMPRAILLRNNGLHIELKIDHEHFIGRNDKAGICNIIMESAITVIMDCEDSIAAVDAADKVVVYRNWLGLMRGDLTHSFIKNDTVITRRLNEDRVYIAPNGKSFSIKGRGLMLVRNVGNLMTTSAVLDKQGNEVFEGLLDAMITVSIALYDLKRGEDGKKNSTVGSIYIVKPKLHGPREVAFVDEVFTKVEEILGLKPYTVKLGIMDEERRTTVNLAACIKAAKHRVAFINTGFLDRTGDEINTSMEAGVFLRKEDIKLQPWIAAYEDHNVDVGLACGLHGRGQIGKGMWAAPDLMDAMLKQKISHPQAGGNTAWVPNPTAATLHAIHYHKVNVEARQKQLMRAGKRASLDIILQIPLANTVNWSQSDIINEVENNVQGILGYVVRWIDQGIGCSKVLDINNIALMEDRATCRISAQHVANWLYHGVVSSVQVLEVMKRMARVVDQQNVNDSNYHPMSPDFTSLAFQAACDLVFKGVVQPSGYTEPILYARRLEKNAIMYKDKML